jgi:RNA polymerase subunit RPABC4/transcription elongation factor Spt4
MTDPSAGSVPVQPVPVEPCPHCAQIVPVGAYCGICGGHLAHADDRHASRRPHAYAAYPDEPVVRLSVVTSLFPHLSRRATVPFRVALALLVGLLVLFSATGLEAPVIAIAALGVPLLFHLYVYEIDLYEDRSVLLGVFTLVLGGGLGVGWALLGGPVVANALQPSLGQSLGGARSLEAALAVPAIGQVLMCVPMLAVRLWVARAGRERESLDGFVLGAAGALGFSFAAVLANLASQLSGGVVVHSGFTSILTEAFVRGLAVPAVAAAGTGLIGAALWMDRTEGLPWADRWRTSALGALALALLVQVGLGFADQARLADLPLILIHLAGAAVLVLFLRVGLHHIVLHEQRQVVIGAPRGCTHCHHLVPAMPFCPVCGVAEVATPKRNGRAGSPGSGDRSWPIVPSDQAVSWTGYPLEPPALTPRQHRVHHALLLGGFLAGLAILTVALLLTALEQAPTGSARQQCRLLCIGTADAATGPALGPAKTYTDTSAGFSVAGLLANPEVNPGLFRWSESTSGSIITFTLTGSSGTIGGKSITIGGGDVQFAGVPITGSATAESVVDNLLQQNAPSAQLVYPLPDPLVGYVPGYGGVYDVQSTSADGSASDTRLVVLAAVRNGVAVVVWAHGPMDASFAQSPLLNHPSFVDLDIGLVLDPLVNSVTWTGPGSGARS